MSLASCSQDGNSGRVSGFYGDVGATACRSRVGGWCDPEHYSIPARKRRVTYACVSECGFSDNSSRAFAYSCTARDNVDVIDRQRLLGIALGCDRSSGEVDDCAVFLFLPMHAKVIGNNLCRITEVKSSIMHAPRLPIIFRTR